MLKENKNFENLKKKRRNWIGWIGLSLIVINVVLASLIYLPGSLSGGDEALGYMTILFFIILPLFILGVIFIFCSPVKIKGSILKGILLLGIILSPFILRIGFFLSFVFIPNLYEWLTETFYQRAEVFRKEAVATKDLNKCFDIKMIPLLPYQLSDFSSDFFFIPSDYRIIREECLADMAVLQINEELCNKIKGTKVFNKCITEMAIATKDTSLCKKTRVFTVYERDYCLERVAAALKNEILCETEEFVGLNIGCYIKVAKAKQDSAICEKIDELYYKEQCLEEVAITKNDSTLCQKINDEFILNKCLAKTENNLFYCEEIKDEGDEKRWHCYIELAEFTKNESLCEKIADPKFGHYLKEECYMKVAIAKNDFTLCEKVGLTKSYCRYYRRTHRTHFD